MTLVTYIIKAGDEYYCNRTNCLLYTLQQHRNPQGKSWFYPKDRKNFKEVIYFKGDHMRQIKAFGSQRFWKLVKTAQKLPLID